MFAFQDAHGSVEIAFTDRHGGIGGGPHASLDLASHRQGDAEQARANVETVSVAFTGGPVRCRPPVPRRTVLMRQVHGADVVVVDDTAPAPGEQPVADALVTAVPGVVLLVRVADCVPVLLGDATAGVVAAVHAGRAGLVAGVVPRAVAAMRSLGASRIRGWVGPHVCGACYEVPEQLRAEVAGVVHESHAVTSWGTPSLDLGAGVRAQLVTEGIETTDVARCTVEDQDLFSYRRQGSRSGRLGGLVWVRP